MRIRGQLWRILSCECGMAECRMGWRPREFINQKSAFGIATISSGSRFPDPGSRRWRGGPQFCWDRQQPVSLPQRNYQPGVIAFRELSCNESVAETSNFIFVKVSEGVSQLLGRRFGGRDQTMARQNVEHPLVIRIHAAV